ncbi:Basic helix-loop-helix DNA-binding superfamily protein [Hibiscus syriacus]|uniref:Basic helix-loop-helix DNA-binding superfamily protein n=1 Tax=Hibiscus syriacus TaxID=106335 RepID=A0A6A2ZDX2_HIBSY|nr:transcription factor EMB1444-like [Hibiscus syriacus]KAE8689786.1 Basic helix-loop-helix DNA-binding superfamily protein [Hibiscus syriacus]
MANSSLRQFLKSFCTNSPWKYAVLWKLRHRSPLVLTWEDGYCVYPIPRESVENISTDVYPNSEIIPSHFEMNIPHGRFGGYPIGLLVARMSHLKYAWGEGFVGKVAYTGKHCWISYDNIFTGKADLKLAPEWPEEWLLQFASGIKTIVLVSVLQHGVLQLGSSEMVAEDLSIPAYIKDKFACKNIHTQLTYSVILSPFEKLEVSSSELISPLNSEDSKAVDSVEPNKLLALDQIVPLLSFPNELLVPEIHLPETLENASDSRIRVQPVSLCELPSPLSQSVSVDQLAITESELFGLYCLKEELQAYPECNVYRAGECGEILDEVTNSYPACYFLEPSFGDYEIDNAGFLNFPKERELHKALGPVFERQGNQYLLESSFLSEDAFRDDIDAKGGDAGYLLQAVVGHVYDGSVDIANKSTSIMTSTGQLPVPSRPQSVKTDSYSSSRLMSAVTGGVKSNPCSKISASFKSSVRTITDYENPANDDHYTQSRKGKKQSTVRKKRARPGDNPRPRDRQMIQERLKELRELVPNGPKYSIDALLDQTVKHMLYLRSVTKQAEKLRQWVDREVSDLKNMRLSVTKDGYQNGTSWAFEIGDERKVCPIVVKDLAYPGHLLIEMICNEHGLFLDIAQVIQSFNLTILKGVMGSCSNNTWAHFIVEASSGFHRLDIFWPLMKLLQRQRNPISRNI